jgi:hypothetical protein
MSAGRGTRKQEDRKAGKQEDRAKEESKGRFRQKHGGKKAESTRKTEVKGWVSK